MTCFLARTKQRDRDCPLESFWPDKRDLLRLQQPKTGDTTVSRLSAGLSSAIYRPGRLSVSRQDVMELFGTTEGFLG